MGAAGRGSGVLQRCVFPLCQRLGSRREIKKRPSDALMMLPWARTNSTLSPDPPPPALGFRLPPAHKVICRQIISMTSDSNKTLLAVVLVWLNLPLRAQLVSGFQEGERKDKLATVSAGAQLVVLANDTGDQCCWNTVMCLDGSTYYKDTGRRF